MKGLRAECMKAAIKVSSRAIVSIEIGSEVGGKTCRERQIIRRLSPHSHSLVI
jgi:hypothetical protein